MDTANNLSFALLIALFTLGTYVVAFTFESITDQWARFKRAKLQRRKHLASSPGSDDHAKSSSGSLNMAGGNGVARTGTGTSSWLRRRDRARTEDLVPEDFAKSA